MNGAIFYATKYGSTGEYARLLTDGQTEVRFNDKHTTNQTEVFVISTLCHFGCLHGRRLESITVDRMGKSKVARWLEKNEQLDAALDG